jgi:glycosyltransferase involved in cell wall biosynthesis
MKPVDGSRPRVCIICTTPLAIHFFLRSHIRALATFTDVTLVTNLESDIHTPPLDLPIRMISIEIMRKIDLGADIRTLVQLIHLLHVGSFDLVWAVGPKAGLLGMLASRFTGVKNRLFIFQGEVWASKTGFKRWLIKFMDGITARTASHLLAVSHSECAFLEVERVVPLNKISVLGAGSIGGVDTKKYQLNDVVRRDIREELAIPAYATVVLYLGRLDPDKGIFDLVHAFRRAREKCEDLWLLIVGPDEGSMTKKIQDTLGPNMSHCRFVGFTSNPAAYFSTADFLCLPSYREGFPISILEAAATGIPTIGSRIYGISDAIIEEKTGVMFETKNIEELSQAIILLTNDSSLRHRMGQAARDRVCRDFEHQVVVERYTDYFKQRLKCR